jgi:beta-lactam-binding protein with PASTA domain
MPNLAGMQINEATSAMNRFGVLAELRVPSNCYYSSGFQHPTGIVASQDLPPGALLSRFDAETIVVSITCETYEIKMPNLIGMNSPAAFEAMGKAGLLSGTVDNPRFYSCLDQYSNPDPNKIVTFQSLPPGTLMESWQIVTIHCGK